MNIFEKVIRVTRGAGIITDWLGSGGQTVQPERAQHRANVCLECPLNNKTTTVTGVVSYAIKEQMAIKNALDMRVDGEKSLGFCDICLCQLKLKVWIPIQRIMPQAGDDFPPNCWIVQETTPNPDWRNTE